MKKLFAFLALLFFTPGANAAFLHGASSPLNTKTVTANLASTSYTIPNNFVGWSQELADVVPGGAPISGGGSLFTSSNTTLIGLAQLLGTHGYIRVGGNSQDTPNSYTSTIPDATSYAAGINSFVSGIGAGWTLNWGLDGKVNDSTTAVAQAGILISAVTGNPLVFSTANEPELWSGVSESQFQTRWNSYYSALTTAQPSIVMEAPELAFTGALSSWFGGLTPGLSGLNFVTEHWYDEGGNQHSIATIVANGKNWQLTTDVNNSSGKFRLGECGIDYLKGTTGIVDRLVAANWWLNVALNLAAAGGIGIACHEVMSNNGGTASGYSGTANYNDFSLQGDGGYSAAPRFYGLFLFSKIEGQQIVSTTLSGTGTVNAISTKGANGNANILAINDDTVNSVSIKAAQNNSWSTANVLLLKGNSGCTEANPTIGGQPIGEGGTWTGGFTTTNNGSTVTVPPCGAVLIQIQP